MNADNLPALRRLPFIILGILGVVAGSDVTWAELGHFQIVAGGYGLLAVLTGVLWAAGFYYQRVRQEPHLAAMLIGAAFLVGFSAAASVLNAFLVTVAGPRIDVQLAAMDRLLGVDWPAMMKSLSAYPTQTHILKLVYISVLPQIALVIIMQGWRKQALTIYSFCLAIAFGAIVSIFIWTLFPSFGAMSIYALDPGTTARINALVDGSYGQALIGMLSDGPGLISPDNTNGMIGFPSYHVVLAILVTWYAWDVPYARIALLILNAGVVVATPIHGGHHIVDMLGSIPVAIVSVVLAQSLVRYAAHMTPPLLRDIPAVARK